MSRCRCGHEDTEHPPFHPAFETQHCTGACARCDCPYFHTSTYRKHISALRRAATSERGKPLHATLFLVEPAKETENNGDPAKPLAPKAKEATP
jgi:hypothetical protein